MTDPAGAAPRPFLQIANVRRFILFRVFFNARYYYPIFTLLFLDFGLTLEQFAILNVIWAATIVLAEVPSGALADIIGRRNLLIAGAILMIIEMAVICAVPFQHPWLLFPLFVINRVCSGLAEAMVSGADEALAYDSLAAEGDKRQWPLVLERTARAGSAAMFAAMIIGAVLYDPARMSAILGWLGFDTQLTRADVIRLPVALTLVHACFVLYQALRMREPVGFDREPFSLRSITRSFTQIASACRWTFNHRFVLFVTLGGMLLDSTARHYIILNAKYLEMIQIPIAWFGLIAASLSLLGMVHASIARYLATRHTPVFNVLALSLVLLVSLYGIQWVIPWFGVLFVIGVHAMFTLVGFLQSHYINHYAESRMRATVLSLKSFGLNLGLGFASLLYTGLIVALKQTESAAALAPDPTLLQDHVFTESLAWLPPYFALAFVLFVATAALMVRDHSKFKTIV